MIPKQLFENTYNKLNLSTATYYIYGSGKCCDEIIEHINEGGLTLPAKILDQKTEQKKLYNVVDMYTQSETELKNSYIIIASLSFYREVALRILSYFDISSKQIISLQANHSSNKVWSEYSKLSYCVFTQLNPNSSTNSHYSEHRFYRGIIQPSLVAKAQDIYTKTTYNDLSIDDYTTDYLYSDTLSLESVEEINSQQSFSSFDESSRTVNEQIINELYDEVKNEIKSDWKVLNIRVWKNKATTDGMYASNKLHTDGFHQDIKKILIFLTPPSLQTGSTEVILQDGTTHLVTGASGTWLLFDSSMLVHRGITVKDKIRTVIELTIANSTLNRGNIEYGGNNARYPELPWKRCISNINLGGGPSFKSHGWINYDAIKHPNVTQINFNENTILDHQDNSISLVYSSHFFEHINTKTLDRLLLEVSRILRNSGDFVIKLPNFEDVLSKYHARDNDYFTKWNISEEMIGLWESSSVEDTIENRASLVFCGYWNSEYGDHFSNQHNFSNAAYHGPAKICNNEIKNILNNSSPNIISKTLKKLVQDDTHESEISFNHQNAWSKNELISALVPFGFQVTSTDLETIKTYFPEIPDLLDSKDISMYLSFKKVD